MKLLHIADLHIGKRVNEFQMLEDQRFLLEQLLHIAEEHKPDGVLIAGDIYDKNQPSAEAVELLDEFLTRLTGLGNPVFLISGNHDSPERLSFGSRLLGKNGLHIAGAFSGAPEKFVLKDAYGTVSFYLLPFLKPAMVRPYFEQPIETYDDAVRAVLSAEDVDKDARNVLLAHQFVTAGTKEPERSDSESISIGGLDNVDICCFDAFDYVALGHLHGPQRIGRDTVRYAGSPLKYSFSESRHKKSAVLVELKEKGTVTVQLLPLTPLRDLREIKGPISELLRAGREDACGAEDYIHAILTDEDALYDAIGQLREVYPNLMSLDLESSRSNTGALSEPAGAGAQKNPLALFAEFYQLQNQQPLSEEQVQVLEKILEQTGGTEA